MEGQDGRPHVTECTSGDRPSGAAGRDRDRTVEGPYDRSFGNRVGYREMR